MPRLTSAQQTHKLVKQFIINTLNEAVAGDDLGDRIADQIHKLQSVDTSLCTTDSFIMDDADVSQALEKFVENIIGSFQQFE